MMLNRLNDRQLSHHANLRSPLIIDLMARLKQYSVSSFMVCDKRIDPIEHIIRYSFMSKPTAIQHPSSQP